MMPTNLARTSFPLGVIDEPSRSVWVMASTTKPVEGEALVSWDLTRFAKNPQVLWNHDTAELSIGVVEEIDMQPDGMRMRVRFALPTTNPKAEQIWSGVREKVIRAVSVGFDPGKSTESNVDGAKVVTRTANELLELSFVTIPADEDALVVEETDEMRKLKVSNAARELAKSRHTRTDADEVQRFDVGGRLSKTRRTSLGGAYVPARLSRTGVLTYRLSDGTTRRELRHPDEVFKADSLATLEDIPVIDIKDHTAILSPDDYRRASLGHVKSFRQDGRFILSELVVQDQATLDAIDTGERTEISCGYVCKLDMTPGVYDGEPYDCIQRAIKYNHVALCPPNRGRAGPEVGLRLDEQSPGAISHFDSEEDMKIIHLDGKDYNFGSDEHIAKLDAINTAALAKAGEELAAAVKRADETQGRLDAAEAAAKKAKEKAEEDDAERKRSAKAAEGSTKERLRARFKRFQKQFRAFFDDEEDDDKEGGMKMDALIDALLDDASAQTIMVEAITKSDPEFKADGKSAEYIEGRFDALSEASGNTRGVDSIVRATEENARRLDAKKHPVEVARQANQERERNLWKAPAAGEGDKR